MRIHGMVSGGEMLQRTVRFRSGSWSCKNANVFLESRISVFEIVAQRAGGTRNVHQEGATEKTILGSFCRNAFSHSLGQNPNASSALARPVPPGADMVRNSNPLASAPMDAPPTTPLVTPVVTVTIGSSHRFLTKTRILSTYWPDGSAEFPARLDPSFSLSVFYSGDRRRARGHDLQLVPREQPA
jgi:hypothetical protein